MLKPPRNKPVHVDSPKTTVRIPRALRDEIQASADREARSLNAEILIRLQASSDDEAKRRHGEVMSMLQRIFDQK